MIVKKCENCAKYNTGYRLCEICRMNDCEVFEPSEQAIRQDEREKIILKIKEKISICEKALDDMLTDTNGFKCIEVTYMNRKEKAEITNKRKCIIAQKYGYEDVLNTLYKLKKEQKTNRDMIVNMNSEELANILCKMECEIECEEKTYYYKSILDEEKFDDENDCKEHIKKWLESKISESETINE